MRSQRRASCVSMRSFRRNTSASSNAPRPRAEIKQGVLLHRRQDDAATCYRSTDPKIADRSWTENEEQDQEVVTIEVVEVES